MSNLLAARLPIQLTDPTAGLQPISWWETQFLGVRANNTATARALFATGDSWDMYNGAYYIDGETAMFRATGSTTYLDRALEYAETCVSNAAISSSLGSQAWGDSFYGWTSYKNTQTGQEVPLYESYCWRYVTGLLRAMKANATVYANTGYKARYDALLAFTEQHVFTKWRTRGANSYIYRSRTHMAAHWGLIAHDLAHLSWGTTVGNQAEIVATNINLDLPNYTSSMRGQLVVSGSDYFWSDVWGDFSHPGQDVSHGNAVIAMMVEQHRVGREWTNTDMARMCHALNYVIWPTMTTYKEYVDGSGVGNGWFSDGFCKLGRYNKSIQTGLEAHTVGRGVQLYGNGALNVRLIQLGSPLL